MDRNPRPYAHTSHLFSGLKKKFCAENRSKVKACANKFKVIGRYSGMVFESPNEYKSYLYGFGAFLLGRICAGKQEWFSVMLRFMKELERIDCKDLHTYFSKEISPCDTYDKMPRSIRIRRALAMPWEDLYPLFGLQTTRGPIDLPVHPCATWEDLVSEHLYRKETLALLCLAHDEDEDSLIHLLNIGRDIFKAICSEAYLLLEINYPLKVNPDVVVGGNGVVALSEGEELYSVVDIPLYDHLQNEVRRIYF